jgi:hypothetical protein
MKFFSFLLLLLICSQDIAAQKKLTSITDFLHHRNGYVDEVVPIKNPNTNELAILFTQGKRTYAYLLDKHFNKLDSLTAEDKRRKYKQVIGNGTTKDGNYIIYLSNTTKTRFASITFSFSEKKSAFTEFNFELDNERFIQTSHISNAFYILTIEKKSSILNTYKFEDNNPYVKNNIDLEKQSFVDEKEKAVSLYDLITASSGLYSLGKKIDVSKIDAENPTTLEIAFQPTKLFSIDKGFLISFDENKNHTQLLELNLEQSNYNFYKIEKPLANISKDDKTSNSFIHQNEIYTITAVDNLIYLQSKNYKTGKLINEHSVYPEETITLKNAPVVQTGGEFSNRRELEKTEKIFRKLNRGSMGISVFKNNDFLNVTYGSIKETKTNPALFFPGFGIPIASAGALSVSLYINPAFFAFESYTNTKAIKINAIFNDSFEHLQGQIPENTFDKIKKFEEKEKISRNGKTIFRLNDNYIFGSYDSWFRTYTFWEFL